MVEVRNVSGSLTISGVDDEWPGGDETAAMTWPEIWWGGLTYTEPPEPAPLYFELKWGGECRVEVDLAATVVNRTGTVELRGSARLYEGDSEDTRDLEEEEPIVLTLLKGRVTRHTVQLESQGVGGGDRATVEMTFVNTADESQE